VTAGAVDLNQGCTGFLYGLSIADGLIKAGTASRILLLTAETSSRYINEKDKSIRFLFGDGASASIISSNPGELGFEIGKFVVGTDGKGFENIIIKYGGARHPISEASTEEVTDEYGNIRTALNFYMNGNSVFLFSINLVPKLIRQILDKSGLKLEEVDLFVMHQANKIILETIRKKLCISEEKMVIDIENTGNTVSSSVPIVLKNVISNHRIKSGDKLLLVAFGVGYSWGATVITAT
jgi:3-oxoacyl-[acyl-carrier-protein] synthase-3